MTTLLEIPLKDAQDSDIQNFRAKYPDATLRIETDSNLHSGDMDEAQFWAIISLFDWKTRDSEVILAPAVNALSRLSRSDIEMFHELMNQKLYALDGRLYAEQLGSNRYAPDENKGFSADSFLYARCCVVANGKVFFEKVLEDPSKMPKEFTFESLLYLPKMAWALKTGRDDYAFFPETWSETFSNSNGWPGMTSLKDTLIELK
jgi:Protein of unknown function (DUF4240)